MAGKTWGAVLAAVAVTVVALTAPAASMTTRSTFDHDDHPAVVALLVTVSGGGAFQFCSGTLVTPTVVVTAGHCVSAAVRWGPGRVLVTNDPSLPADATGRITVGDLDHASPAASLEVNPAYRPVPGTDSYREDVSAITVADPDALARPGGIDDPALPAAGALEVRANALDLQVIHETQQIHQDRAGACHGDSGGPTCVELDGVPTIVGVTSTGDIPCWSTNTAARIGRASVLAFLGGVIAPG